MDAREYLRRLREAGIRDGLPFPPEEYQGRIARVREEMAGQGFDALIVCTAVSLNYLIGYYTFSITNFTALLLPLEGAPSILTASSEIPAVALNGWVDDVSVLAWNESDHIVPTLAKLLEAKGLARKRVGIELDRGGPVPRIVDGMTRALPNARFADGSSVVPRVRIIKSERELGLMRKAGEITARGINASLSVISAGITDNDVAAPGYAALVAAGSESMAVNPIVNSGYRSSWHHSSFKRVTFREGDAVFLEYGGALHRYHAPMMRTAVIGHPSDDVRRVADAVEETLRLLLGAAKAGRTAHDVAREAHRGYAELEDEGWFMGLCGYSVGIGFPPTWADAPMFIAEGIDTPLVAGMAFHLPIMFRVPGKFGIGLSETIAITETGCEVLTEPTRAVHVALVGRGV